MDGDWTGAGGVLMSLADPEGVAYPGEEDLVAFLRLLLDEVVDEVVDLLGRVGYLLPHHSYRLEDALLDQYRIHRHLVLTRDLLDPELVGPYASYRGADSFGHVPGLLAFELQARVDHDYRVEWHVHLLDDLLDRHA